MTGLGERILMITNFLSQQEKNNRELGVLPGEGKLGYEFWGKGTSRVFRTK